MSSLNEPRYVTVVWRDAFADGVEDVTWEQAKDKHRPIIMETRGYLLVDDEVGVSLFSERCREDQTFRGRTFILRANVISVEDFPTKRKRKPPKPKPPQAESEKPSNP